MRVRRKRIRQIVDEILNRHGIDAPPIPIQDIIEQEAITIANRAVEDDVSGFLVLTNGKSTIGANKNHPQNRRRFTLAHELGHYFLHVNSDDRLRVDRRSQVMLRSNLSSEGEDNEEREANLFAAELLMPQSFLRNDWVDLQDTDIESAIQELARKYRVSSEAMQYRLTNLGFIKF
jgi:Zn-dependent peptidase ImmA (M78 family)